MKRMDQFLYMFINLYEEANALKSLLNTSYKPTNTIIKFHTAKYIISYQNIT